MNQYDLMKVPIGTLLSSNQDCIDSWGNPVKIYYIAVRAEHQPGGLLFERIVSKRTYFPGRFFPAGPTFRTYRQVWPTWNASRVKRIA